MIPPELAEARLAGVQAALDLGDSLASARGAPLPFSTFEARSLRVTGRLASSALRPSARALLEQGQGQPRPNEVLLLVSFAGANLQVGTEFDILLAGADRSTLATRAILVGVVPKFGGSLLDYVPRGHETICVVQFPTGIPQAIAALPEVDGWTHEVIAWLGNRARLERTRRSLG